MSRDYRDKRGGHWTGKFYISDKSHREFSRQCRRSARAKTRHALRNGREPEPRYAIEKEYYD